MSENSFKPFITLFLNKHQLKIEAPIAVLFIIGILLAAKQIDGALQMVGFSLTALAILYYFKAFTLIEGKSMIIIVSRKVIWISSSVSSIGIMFQLFQLSGSKVMLFVGQSSLIIATCLLYINELLSEDGIQSSRYFVRALLIIVIGTFIYFYPPFIH